MALAESWRVLQPGGLILLRVRAHPWLEGEHDTVFNTGRRFQRSDLVTTLVAAGFCLSRVTYANALLSPPIVLLRLLERWGWRTLAKTSLADSPADRLFAAALGLEARWLAYGDFGFGISLYALATKQQSENKGSIHGNHMSDSSPALLVCTVLPTYNERENIGPLIHGILASATTAQLVLVVDDGSPDGTAERVAELAAQHNTPALTKVVLIQRRGEKGLTSAIQRGIDEAINQYEAEIVT